MAREEREKGKERKALAPWRPFSEMARWEQEMERMFDDFFGRRLRPIWDERWWPTRAIGISAPAVDLYEDKEVLVAKVELPGMGKEDIQVNIADHHLTIKAESYYRSERSYGSFSRTVDLPAEVQVEKAQASFKNGVLEIRLPKSEEAKKKEIKVKVE